MRRFGKIWVLSLKLAEIKIQILVDARFDCIAKGVLFRITGIKILNQD